VPAVLDPMATNGSTGILLLAGTNAALRPEHGETWTAGFDLTPPQLPGFTFNATYFDLDFSDRISDPGSVAAALADGTGFEDVLIRDPSAAQIAQYLGYANTVLGAVPPDGVEAIWDGRLRNLASLRVRGIDLRARYDHDTAFGHMGVFADASLLLQYTSKTGPTSTSIDALDTIFHPVDWRIRAGLDWSRAGWDASLSMNYVDDYTDNISSPARRIGAWTTFDLRVTRDWRANPRASGVEIALSIENLFDTDPPFANNPIGYGFDAQAASPIGRFAALEVRRTW
jgi:outer membrane cobalamin receptor